MLVYSCACDISITNWLLYFAGLELVNQTSGSSLDNPIVRLENETFDFMCEFTYPTDILGTVNIKWIAGGLAVVNSSTLFYRNLDISPGRILSLLTFNPLNVFIDIHNPPHPFRRVYNCEGIIDDRFDNVVKSDAIHLDVECKWDTIHLHASFSSIHLPPYPLSLHPFPLVFV